MSDRLKTEIGTTAFENWVKPIRACDFENAQVRLSVPSRFMRDWVVANYLDRLKELWAGENDGVRSVDLFIQPTQKRPNQDKADSDLPAAKKETSNEVQSSMAPGKLVLDARNRISAPLDARFKFDQFVVGKPNEFAYAAAEA